MAKINKDNILKQLGRMEEAYEDMAVMSKPICLSIKEIQLNPDNIAAQHDSDEEIRALADSIQASGLIHPLTVNKTGEHQYMLLSGERRFKAITTYLDWENVQCTVYDNLDPSLAVVVTVEANMETREYSVADRLALYQQLDAALRNLKAKGKYKGAIGHGIAERMKISEKQVSVYRQIIENTTEEERKNIGTKANNKVSLNTVIEGIREKKKSEKFLPGFKFSGDNSDKHDSDKFLPGLKNSSVPLPVNYASVISNPAKTVESEAQKTKTEFQFSPSSESSTLSHSPAAQQYQSPSEDADKALIFSDEEHASFYKEKTRELKADAYLKSLIYTIGICDDTRRRWNKLYDEKERTICPEQIFEPWQTGTSLKVTRLAFQLFTDSTPTTSEYDESGNFVKENIEECRRYSVSDIFCCEYAPYFIQAVQIRYPDYF